MDDYNCLMEKLKKNCFDPAVDDSNSILDERGVYLICMKTVEEIPELMEDVSFKEFCEHKILYIGLSKQGLRTRDYKTHFNGTARRSTLRKSLGTLFGYERVQNKNEFGTIKYRFTKDCENKLSQWMKENLLMYYCTGIENVDLIESILIERYNPPINIAKNKNEINKAFRIRLRQLRCQKDF